MVVKVIGLIELNDLDAFELYRHQVGATVEKFSGHVLFRGDVSEIFWNELNAETFNSYVELVFPTLHQCHQWIQSPEYQRLLKVRNQALKVTLFSVQEMN